MEQRLPWRLIQEYFQGQWVELVDSEWKWNSAHPSLARVRHHAGSRRELMQQIKKDRLQEGSVLLFINPAQLSLPPSKSSAVC